MAPETAARTEIDLRWEMANYGEPTRYGGASGFTETIGADITKRHQRITDGLEELAAMLVNDGVWKEEMEDGGDSLQTLIGETWEAIETLLKAWATREPERRDAIRAQWAVEQASGKASAA